MQQKIKDICRFIDIENNKFFIHEEIKLCKFGTYGMGIDANGSIAKKFKGNELVLKC